MNDKKGFTLIELLIALAVAALMIGIGLPSVKRVFRTNLKSASAQLSSFIRFAYDNAIIKHKVHRIVFDIDKRTYRLEIATKDTLINYDKANESYSTEEEQNSNDKKVEKIFVSYPGELGKDKTLPSGVNFEDIENITTQKKTTSDITYMYFFPHGLTESMIIRLSGGKAKTGYYSIKVNPINGKTKIEGRYIER